MTSRMLVEMGYEATIKAFEKQIVASSPRTRSAIPALAARVVPSISRSCWLCQTISSMPRILKKVLISIFVFWVFISTCYGGTFYKWVDKDGAVNFTDNYNHIPSEYRNQAQREEFGEPQEVESPPIPPASTHEGESARVDIYGKGEDYWRAKVQLWKKQLQEATENIEGITRKINERAEEEAGKNLSHAQRNMDLAYRNQLLEELSKYQAQVRKANEMLSKITKEAKEAKASPEWLR